MKTYRDGDDEYTIIRPGDQVPGHYTGPAERGDFSWMNSTWLERFRGKQKGKSLQILNENLGLATNYNNQHAAYIRSQHAIVEANNDERLLPLKAEARQAELQLSIVRTHGAIHDDLERRERAQLEHKRRITELKGAAKAAKSRNKQQRRARRRARDAERRRDYDQSPPPPPPRPNGGGAAAFHRHYRTMEEVKTNLSEGERRLQEIYGRAAAQRRNLTDDEMMEVDAITDAMRAAKDEVIRTGASDLGAADD